MDFADKEIRRLERRKLRKDKPKSELENRIREKIPKGLSDKLTAAFTTAFKLLIEKGTSVITKTYDKEGIETELDVYTYLFEKNKTKRNWKRLNSKGNRRRLIDSAVTTFEGALPGLLGIGLPDIPLFTAFILRGVYETALTYGFDCDKKEERYFALKLIEGAMVSGEAQQAVIRSIKRTARLIAAGDTGSFDLDAQLRKTSRVLSEAMIAAKFVQGIPLVGVIGGAYNLTAFRRITGFARREYQLRYLYKIRK